MKAIAVLLAGLVSYALAGFIVVPYLVENEISTLPVTPGQRINVDEVAFNPFTFQLRMRGLSVAVSGAAPHLSTAQITAYASLTSLTRRTWIFRNITIDAPDVTLSGEGPDDPLAALANALAWAFADSADAGAARVTHVVVNGGQLRFVPHPFATSSDLQDIELEMHNPGTQPATPTDFSLTARLNETSAIASRGQFSFSPPTLEATLEVASLDAAMLLGYVDPQPGFDALSGQSAVDGKVTYGKGIAQFRGTLESKDVEVIQTAGAAPVFAADRILATAVSITSPEPSVTIGDLRIENPHLAVKLNADGTLNLPQWLVRAMPGFDPNGRVKQVSVTGGSVMFSDRSLPPTVQILASELNATMMDSDAGVEFSSTGRINESGKGHVSGNYQPSDGGFATVAKLRLDGFDLSAVSPWFQQAFARQITSGFLTLRTNLEGAGPRLKVDNQVVIDALVLADPEAAVSDLDLAVALLEDERRRIRFTLPIAGHSTPFDTLLADALRDFVDRLAREPLSALATEIGAESSLDCIGFLAGSTAFTPYGERVLESLIRALHERPRLGTKVIPRYHPRVDRDALARKQVMLHIALASSAGPPASSDRSILALDDPKVISILDEFANARLPANVLDEIGARFESRNEPYNEALLQALIDNETVSRGALERVARYRAQAIADALAATGVTAERLAIGEHIETAGPNEDVTSRVQLFAPRATRAGAQVDKPPSHITKTPKGLPRGTPSPYGIRCRY